MSTVPLNDLKTYAEIMEIGVKVAAMIIAAVWAIYGLIVFRRRQAAVTALRKAQSEAASLELAAKRRAVLDISLKCDVHHDSPRNGYILAVQVAISNSGVDPAFMQFDETKPPLRVQRLAFDEKGGMSLVDEPKLLAVPRASDFKKPSRSRVIRAGGTARLNSIVRLVEPGAYAVSFRVPMDEHNRTAMHEAGASKDRTQYWTATTFAFVEPDQDEGAAAPHRADEPPLQVMPGVGGT